MIQVKAGKRKVVASALTFCFFLQQSFCLQVVATNITGVEGVNGVFNIDPTATNGDIGFRKYNDFNLSQGDIANLIFHDSTSGKDISTFVNLVDNTINIRGIVNAVNAAGNIDGSGHAVFVSPNGMVVGASGVLNVGSLSILTPEQSSYEKYKSDLRNPTLIKDYESRLSTPGNGNVSINGNVLARDFIDINAANVNIGNNAILLAGVKDNTVLSSGAQAERLFNQLVNTDNVSNANNLANENGSIVIKSYGANGGTNVAGTMKNFGAGNIQITNSGSRGVNISGTTTNFNGNTLIENTNGGVSVSGNVENSGNAGSIKINNSGAEGVNISGELSNYNTAKTSGSIGEISIRNTGSKGIYVSGTVSNSSKGQEQQTNILNYNENSGIKISNTGKVVTDGDVNIINNGTDGINVNGIVNGNNINIDNQNSNVVLGYNTGKDYLNASNNVNISVVNGNLLNYGTTSNLIKAGNNLNIDVQNGSIGKEVGPCDGGICTGIGPDARDLTKSVNIAVDGKVSAESTKGSNNSLINLASIDKNMNVDRIKADGRVILLADSSVKGSKAYDIVNASTDSTKPNVEGAGISIISSGNIGSKDNALTFRQTQGVFGNVDSNLNYSSDAKYGVDMLAIKDINIKGLGSADGEKLDTIVCGLISREGSINAEFSGDTYI